MVLKSDANLEARNYFEMFIEPNGVNTVKLSKVRYYSGGGRSECWHW